MEPNRPLQAHSWAEVHYYLMVTPCPDCGRGPWRASPVTRGDPEGADVAATCEACGRAETFRFAAPPPGPAAGQAAPGVAEPVNPTGEPSRIIDLGQWLSLFFLFLQSANREPDKATVRRLGYQAAQCLDEALRFYGDDEVPPPHAFFTETSRRAFREHPERFARQRLRDMRSRLPALPRMIERLAQDRTRARDAADAVQRMRRPWWKFW